MLFIAKKQQKINKMKEIEVRYRLTESQYKLIQQKLEQEENKLGMERQVDTYYTPKHKNYLDIPEPNEWLRLGIRGGKSIFTYKKWNKDKGTAAIICDEYETEIHDHDQFVKILSILDFKEIIKVDKSRCKFKTEDNISIDLDYISDLGYFVEVEYCDIDELKAIEKIKNYTKRLGISEDQRVYVGYPMAMILNNKNKQL